MGTISCSYLDDSSSCGTAQMQYYITFADGDAASGYCYGFGQTVISPAPSRPYSIQWTGTAWVAFTSDFGGSVAGGDWTIRGEYYEPITLKAASKKGISYKFPK